jgi:hypothetical protein
MLSIKNNYLVKKHIAMDAEQGRNYARLLLLQCQTMTTFFFVDTGPTYPAWRPLRGHGAGRGFEPPPAGALPPSH